MHDFIDTPYFERLGGIDARLRHRRAQRAQKYYATATAPLFAYIAEIQLLHGSVYCTADPKVKPQLYRVRLPDEQIR